MVLELKDFDVMEHLWGSLEKTPDGKHIRYLDGDIEQLWTMGFVDTARVDLVKWKALFEPMKQADGTYLLNHSEFIALDDYRYKGEIRIPFDAMLINEGKYTDEGLDELVDASIAPSCFLAGDKLREFMDGLKADFREPDGLILIKKPAKQRIKEMLDKHPSPLRNLELLLNHMLEVKGEELHGAFERGEIDAVTAQAAMQASSFSSTPATRTEAKAQGLKALQKARKKDKPAEVEGKEKTELRKIRRSRKGMRG